MKWLLGALVLLLVGVFFQLGLLVYAMYVLLGVLLISRYLAREWIENLAAERVCDGASLQIGEKANVVVTVRNQGRLPVPWLLLEDSLPVEALTHRPPRLTATGPRMTITRLAPRGEGTLRYQLHFLGRGYYQIGPVLLESGDLFGLHRRYRILTEPHFVLVLPQVVSLEGYDLASRRPVGEIRLTHRLFEDPTRISGVRPYESGDALNRIHWRATARTGVLQSKIFEASCIAGATLLLDFHCNSYTGRGQRHRSELAVTTAASLANALQEMGQQIGFVTNGRDAADRIREEGWGHEFRSRAKARAKAGMSGGSDRLRPIVIETRRDSNQLQCILETLARLELTDGLEFSELISEATSRLPRNATVVAILGDVTDESAAALSMLRRRGYAVTAVLMIFDEPQTPDWARRPDWASWLLSAGVDVRRVENEAALANFCAEQLLR
jgi:uncharacterized protein (DUF58 family)